MKTVEEYLAITGGMKSYARAKSDGDVHFWRFDMVDGVPVPRPCSAGHVAPYYVENRVCFECSRLAVNRHNAAKREERRRLEEKRRSHDDA